MTAPRYLHHVTITSGHERISPRPEVRDEVVESLRPLLDRALRGEHTPVPGQPGYTMTGGAHGRCCTVTLWVEDDGEHVPVITTVVGGHSRCGAHAWRALHGESEPRSGQPPAPWCADRIDPGAVLCPEALAWTGDWSRCIAWTWLEPGVSDG